MFKSLRPGCALGPARRRFAWPAAVLSLLVSQTPARAEEPHQASTSPAARQDAIRAIPMAKIDAKHRAAVRSVISDPSLYRRLPTNVIDCRPELFTYLADNPEVLVAIWRQLGVSQVELVRTGDNTFRLSDGAGTTGRLTVVEQSCDDDAQNRIVMYCDGSYEGKPFNQPLAAQCVVLLRSGSMEETNGRTYVAARLDAFIKLDRMSLELVARAVHPFVGQTADRNFADTLAFVSNFSYTAERRPQGVEELAADLHTVDEPRRTKLVKLAYEAETAGRQWRISRAAQTSGESSARK